MYSGIVVGTVDSMSRHRKHVVDRNAVEARALEGAEDVDDQNVGGTSVSPGLKIIDRGALLTCERRQLLLRQAQQPTGITKTER